MLSTFITLVFVSCEDDDKNPFAINSDVNALAPFVNITSSNSVIDITNLENAGFTGIVNAPSNNVSSWSLNLTRTSLGIVSDTVVVRTITQFPTELNITGTEIAEALNLTTNDLIPGDSIQFIASSTGENGTVLAFENLSSDLSGSVEQNQAYNFEAFISCPFEQNSIIGEYEVINDEWGDYYPGDLITIIAGETDNTYRILTDRNTFLDNASENVWIEVTVDPETGVSTAEANEDFIYNVPGIIVDTVSLTVENGLTLSCTGSISLELDFTFSDGFNDNGYNFELKKHFNQSLN